jgi:Putative addiction module component
MKSDQSTLEDQISRLPDRERARLALRLLESLEPGSDENVDELWLDEAERRLGDYDKGLTEARDADEAIAEIERHLR